MYEVRTIRFWWQGTRLDSAHLHAERWVMKELCRVLRAAATAAMARVDSWEIAWHSLRSSATTCWQLRVMSTSPFCTAA